MTIQDTLSETVSALLSNKVRTCLTMLGIIIGIGSVIAMVAIGQGAQSSIQNQIQSIGANLIMVSPGAQRSVGGYQVTVQRGSAKTLLQTDSDAIQKEIIGIDQMAPEVSGRFQITAKGTNTNTNVIGTTFSYQAVRNIQVVDGDFISDQHVKTQAKVAVLGPTTATDLFGEGVSPLGKLIRINSIQFKVIGVTVAKGGSGFSNSDDAVYVPLSTSQQYLVGGTYLTSINIKALNASEMTTMQEDITTLLKQRHNIAEEGAADFSILNQNDIVQTASSVTGIFTILLGAVAGISLVVGGIGIMNMMLTTVTERTKEIGLRKAIGAKRRDISRQFIAEAIALTVLGGLIGIILGWGISAIISGLGLISASVSTGSILLAFGVSATIGIVFGYYPARRASRLNPIDALRYE